MRHPAGYTAVTDEGVRLITIDRPDRQNSLSRDLQAALVEEFIQNDEDPSIRAVVITGAGDRVFCAGADLKELRDLSAAGVVVTSPMAQPTRSLFEVLAEVSKPTIAALNGAAVAGGFELALACDLRVASAEVRLGLPEAKIGMGATFGSVVLARHLPPALALEMLLTGEYVDAEWAARWGLINELCPQGEVKDRAVAIAAQIAANAPISVRRMKAMVVRGRDLPVAAALRLQIGPDPYTSNDREEGIRAQLERRAPQWTGT